MCIIDRVSQKLISVVRTKRKFTLKLLTVFQLEGKAPLKPLYLDEWNLRRSERIFLSDPSPQTSPNAVSPGVKAKQTCTISPGLKSKQDATKAEKDKKLKQEKQKKSQSFNMSQKVKKKYSTGFNQNKSREKTTELLKVLFSTLLRVLNFYF